MRGFEAVTGAGRPARHRDLAGAGDDLAEDRRACQARLEEEPRDALLAMHEHGVDDRVEVRNVVEHQHRGPLPRDFLRADVDPAADMRQRVEHRGGETHPETALFTPGQLLSSSIPRPTPGVILPRAGRRSPGRVGTPTRRRGFRY